MYRKVIPEVLRLKILKKSLSISTSTGRGGWNAVLSCYWMTLWLGSETLPAEMEPGQSCAHPGPLGLQPGCVWGCRARPAAPAGTAWAQLHSPEPLSPAQDKKLHRKCREMFISRQAFFCVACILAVYLLLKLTVKLRKHGKRPEFWLELGGKKGK